MKIFNSLKNLFQKHKTSKNFENNYYIKNNHLFIYNPEIKCFIAYPIKAKLPYNIYNVLTISNMDYYIKIQNGVIVGSFRYKNLAYLYKKARQRKNNKIKLYFD